MTHFGPRRSDFAVMHKAPLCHQGLW